MQELEKRELYPSETRLEAIQLGFPWHGDVYFVTHRLAHPAKWIRITISLDDAQLELPFAKSLQSR